MQRYKIIVAYDGTDYCGWQRQKSVPSVAQKMEDTFLVVFNKKIAFAAASRTDAGVHALGQVAVFRTDLVIDKKKLFFAWNNLLPPDIVIRKLEVAAPDFNIHKAVELKTYCYHFFTSRPLPFVQRYGWYFRYPVDLAKLEKALQVFIGTHDFRSFCTGDERENTVRTIQTISLEYLRRYNVYRITVKGPRFLKYMIRRIVGAALEVASRPNLSIDYLSDVLQEKNPEQTLPKAPAKGLILYKIKYRGE